MAKGPQVQRPVPRLYLVTPPVADPLTFAQQLGPALAAADVAAVLVRLAPADERTLINRAKALATTIQNAGAAMLLDGHAEIAVRAGADGVHASGIEAFDAAVSVLKPERIVGIGDVTTRHDAMAAGEHGADYVMFGERDTDGRRPSYDAIIERVGWWAEVFEIPCVAAAENFDEIEDMVAAGADFIAVGDFVFADPEGCAAAVKRAAARLAIAEPAR